MIHTYGWEVKLHVYGLVLNGVWQSGRPDAGEMTSVYLVICFTVYFFLQYFFFFADSLR